MKEAYKQIWFALFVETREVALRTVFWSCIKNVVYGTENINNLFLETQKLSFCVVWTKINQYSSFQFQSFNFFLGGELFLWITSYKSVQIFIRIWIPYLEKCSFYFLWHNYILFYWIYLCICNMITLRQNSLMYDEGNRFFTLCYHLKLNFIKGTSEMIIIPMNSNCVCKTKHFSSFLHLLLFLPRLCGSHIRDLFFMWHKAER